MAVVEILLTEPSLDSPPRGAPQPAGGSGDFRGTRRRAEGPAGQQVLAERAAARAGGGWDLPGARAGGLARVRPVQPANVWALEGEA